MEQALKEKSIPTVERIPESTPAIEENPELAYIRSKLTEIISLTDFEEIYNGIGDLLVFINLTKPQVGSKGWYELIETGKK